MSTPIKNPLGFPPNNGIELLAPGQMPATPTNKTKPVEKSPESLLKGLFGGKRRKTNARRRNARSLKRRNNKPTRRH
jgi:hypothetical protein